MKQSSAGLRQSLRGLLVGTLVGLLLVCALYLNICPAERLPLNDLLYPSSDDVAPVAVILVDEEAIHRYGRPERWPADLYRTLILALREAGAQVIALTFPIPPQAEEAIASLPGAEDIVLPVAGVGVPSAGNGRLVYSYLLGPEPGRFSVGHINLVPDADGVLRRLPLWAGEPGRVVPALAWQAAARYLNIPTPLPTGRPLRWAERTLVPDPAGQMLFYFPAPIPTHLIHNPMEPGLPADVLKGRIVFVGFLPEGTQGAYRTPAGRMSDAQFHAYAAAALLLGLTLIPSPALTAVLILLVSPIAGWTVARSRSRVLILAGLVGLSGGLVLSVYGFYQNRLLVDVAFPLVGILLSAFLAALWRSREYSLRRDLLTHRLKGRISSRLLNQMAMDPDSQRLLAPDIRFVAVLFADVRGFVRLTEGQDPRRIQETVNAHLAQFTQAILDADGAVIKYMGDMVAAVFNAPMTVARPADQALCAALEGLRRLRDLWNQNPEMVRMPMGVGIHVGPAVVGLLGPSEHGEYDAIGDTVNVAARLSTYAPAGEVYVTEAVVAMAGKEWRFEPVGTLRLRGRYEPVIVYRLKEACGFFSPPSYR